MNKKIFVFGSSGHAGAVTEVLRELGFKIVGYVDSFAPVGTKVYNHKILGSEEILVNSLKKFKTNNVVVAVGENSGRFEVVQKLLRINKNLVFPSLVSKSARVAPGVKVGPGTVIMKNATVNINSKVGSFVILNTASVVEHDCDVKDFANIATGALLGGMVEVGERAFIGMGAQIIQKKKIGAMSIIGAGSTVIKDLPAKVLAFGNPAKIIKTNYSNKNIFS